MLKESTARCLWCKRSSVVAKVVLRAGWLVRLVVIVQCKVFWIYRLFWNESNSVSSARLSVDDDDGRGVESGGESEQDESLWSWWWC